jgi:hypothetical protein
MCSNQSSPGGGSDGTPSPDPDTTVETLNTGALAGLVLSVAVGVAGLFILPALRSVFGLGFQAAFWLVLAVEFLAAVGVSVSILRLFRQRTFE